MKKIIKLNGKTIMLKIREKFAPKEKVKPSKKIYNRKNINRKEVE